ncbi:MAG: hypothetical protein ACK5Y6_04060 [Pseudomonadota bacterium]|jgi:hypothetical protein
MKKHTLPETPELTDEQLATEMIELTSDEVDALSRAFKMISNLCEQLHEEIAEEGLDIPEHLIH